MPAKSPKIALLLLLLLITGLLAGCNATTTPIPVATATVAPTVTTAPALPSTAVPALPTVTPAPTNVPPTATTALVATTSASVPTATLVPPTNPPSPVASNTPAPVATATPTPLSSNLLYVEGGKLILLNTANGQKQELNKGNLDQIEGDPAWSRRANLIIIAAKAANKGASLYSLSPAGGEAKKLIAIQPADSSDLAPTFAPDGKTVAFTRITDGNKDGKFNEQDNQQEIWLMSPDGQNLRKLADGHHPAFAPDSQRIAYVTNGIDNALKMVNAQGQNGWEPFNAKKMPEDVSKFDYPLSGAASVLSYPSFVDNGRTLAFTATGPNSGFIVTINTTNGGDFKLWDALFEGGAGRTMTNAATGTKMLYESFPPTGFNQIIALDITKAKPAVSRDGRIIFGSIQKQVSAVLPAWSGDGTKIAFVQTTEVSGAFPYKGSIVVATIKADGTTADQKELLQVSQISGIAWEN